jgi:site-specific DNA-cytosine methylase
MRELVIDVFAGGGGASLGIERAGLAVDLAINHDVEALVRANVVLRDAALTEVG